MANPNRVCHVGQVVSLDVPSTKSLDNPVDKAAKLSPPLNIPCCLLRRLEKEREIFAGAKILSLPFVTALPHRD